MSVAITRWLESILRCNITGSSRSANSSELSEPVETPHLSLSERWENTLFGSTNLRGGRTSYPQQDISEYSKMENTNLYWFNNKNMRWEPRPEAPIHIVEQFKKALLETESDSAQNASAPPPMPTAFGPGPATPNPILFDSDGCSQRYAPNSFFS